jgi:hypothetical protein
VFVPKPGVADLPVRSGGTACDTACDPHVRLAALYALTGRTRLVLHCPVRTRTPWLADVLAFLSAVLIVPVFDSPNPVALPPFLWATQPHVAQLIMALPPLSPCSPLDDDARFAH